MRGRRRIRKKLFVKDVREYCDFTSDGAFLFNSKHPMYGEESVEYIAVPFSDLQKQFEKGMLTIGFRGNYGSFGA